MKESLIECYDVAGMFCSMRCLVSLRFHGLSIIGLMTWFDDTKAQNERRVQSSVLFHSNGFSQKGATPHSPLKSSKYDSWQSDSKQEQHDGIDVV